MPHPGAGFPQAFQAWPHVGRQWPAYNVESDQADGLVMWMPWGGGYPGSHSHVDVVNGLAFTEGGTPIWVFDSERGWSLLFDDGSNEYLTTSQAAITGPPYTLAAWIYDDGLADWHTAISLAVSSNNTNYIALLVGSAAVNLYVNDAAGGTGCSTTTGPTVNTWHHVLGRAAAANNRASLIDAGSKGTSAVARTPTGLDCTGLGARVSNTKGWYFSGRISDGRVYNVAKTDADAEQMHTEPWELYQIPRHIWRLGVVAPPPAGQPIHLRALDIPHMRQWQPRVAS